MSERISATVVHSNNLEINNFGVLKIQEYLTSDDSPKMSITVVEVQGQNERVVNTVCDAKYFIIDGDGSFILETDEGMKNFIVKGGDLVVIPKGTFFQDSSDSGMKMLAIYTPAFNHDQLNTATKLF